MAAETRRRRVGNGSLARRLAPSGPKRAYRTPRRHHQAPEQSGQVEHPGGSIVPAATAGQLPRADLELADPVGLVPTHQVVQVVYPNRPLTCPRVGDWIRQVEDPDNRKWVGIPRIGRQSTRSEVLGQ